MIESFEKNKPVAPMHLNSSRGLKSDPLVPGTAPSGVPLTIAVHRGGREIITRHADAWNRVCDRDRAELAFLRAELVAAYFAAFAPDDPVVLLTAHRGDELVGLLPLHEKAVGAGPLRMAWLRSAGNVYFPRFDALCIDEKPADVAERFLGALRREFPDHALHLEMVPDGGIVSRMRELASKSGLVARIHDPDGSPYVAVPPANENVEEFIASQSRRVRRFLRSGLKRLRSHGNVRWVRVDGAAEGVDIAEWLEHFCDLEHRGWKGQAGTSINSNASTRRFYCSLAREKELRSYFRCFALMLNDEMVAGDIGFSVRGTYFSLKLAINESFRDCSPGHLLHLYLLRDGARHGKVELDLGGKSESYKLFWTDAVRPFSNVYIFPPGPKGRLMHLVIFGGVLRAKEYLRTKPLARRGRDALRRLAGRLSQPGAGA